MKEDGVRRPSASQLPGVPQHARKPQDGKLGDLWYGATRFLVNGNALMFKNGSKRMANGLLSGPGFSLRALRAFAVNDPLYPLTDRPK